jgi:hypothetical protein
VLAQHDICHLRDAGRLFAGRLRRFDFDPDRVAQMLLRDRLDVRRHCRGEEGRLPFFRRLREDRFDILGEAHVQHFVSFVEHDGRHRFQRQLAVFDEVQGPSRRGDDDAGPAADRADLLAITGAAIHGQNVDRHRLAVRLHGPGDLDCQFPCRRQDENRNAGFRGWVAAEAVQNRQRKRGRLARAGAGEADEVFAFEQWRDRFALNRRRLGIAQGIHQLEVEPHRGKAGNFGHGLGHQNFRKRSGETNSLSYGNGQAKCGESMASP